MRYLKMLAYALLPVVMLAVAGCGGSGSTASDPFQKTPPSNGSSQDPVFTNLSTATGKMALSLTTDVPSIDVDNGQVLAIAKVKAGEAPVAGMAVTFSVLAPTDLATIANATVTTDSTGTAVTRVTTGHTASTSNVLISATIKVGTQSITTNANFQLIRGGGVIMFTDKAGLSPGGQSDLYPITKLTVPPGGPWSYCQLIPFKVTDSNGNPRVGVPVTLSVYSITSMNPGDVVVDFLVPPVTEPTQQTITTDSAGQGIFNSVITLGMIAAKQTVTVSVVFKAVTKDPNPLTAYLGAQYSFTGEDTTTKTTTPAP
jgi:hypothetical protein